MNNVELTDLVRIICAGTYSQAQLVQFINLTQKISLGYLKYQEVTGKRISGERMETEVELEDLAIDCIAELFSGDGEGNFPQLKKYYEPKLEENPSITDPEVLILTRRLVVRKTKQELSRIFRERDPEGAKIVRNIKVAIRSSEKLNVFHDMGKEFVFYKNGIDLGDFDPDDSDRISLYLRKSSPPIPEDVLHARFIDIYNPNDSVSSSIRKLLKAVYNLEDYQNYLSVDIVVKLLRRVKFDAFRERLQSEEHVLTPVDHIESKEIESYVGVVMDSIWTKIESQYLLTGKLSTDKAQIYNNALRDVLFDLIQKKDNSSYFRNLKYYLPELTQREYRQEERSVFEYLAKVAKKEFRKHLKELF
ncbi:MAG: hypothetical protein GXO75_14460 [Calditrichaeota bacterium]|nr:hypothetical protein [Calditrichota bacterium]